MPVLGSISNMADVWLRAGARMECMTEKQVAKKTIEKLAIVVVTYKRQQLLATLFESIEKLTVAPWRIIVVDNEHSDKTHGMVEEFSAKLTAQWGTTVADLSGNENRVVYAPQTDNLGGAGGFSAGVKKAYELGAEWFWVMDDDVAVMPEGIERLAKWTDRHDVIQGSRYDYDGGPFYWQYDFIVPLGIPNPIAPAAFGPAGYRVMDTLCFEGGLFRRNIVEKIGLPDPRFFIYWDDTMYGYRGARRGAAPYARDRQLGHRRRAPAQLHFRHEPLPHHAQPRLHGPILHDVRRLPSAVVRPGYGADRGQGSDSTDDGGPRAFQDRHRSDRQGMVGFAQAAA